jgi:hypothetical protein
MANLGIRKNVTSDFIFANIRGNPQTYLRKGVRSVMFLSTPYEVFPETIELEAASPISEEQWRTLAFAEVVKIAAAANERRTRLAKMIRSAAPKVPISSRFEYYTSSCVECCNFYSCYVSAEKRCGTCGALCLFICCVGPYLTIAFIAMVNVRILLELFCDLPLGRRSSGPATSQEVEWYTKLMNDNPDLDTFAIGDMVKEELDKLVVRLRGQFPAYKGLHVYTGAHNVEMGSGGHYTLDYFTVVFGEAKPVEATANMV